MTNQDKTAEQLIQCVKIEADGVYIVGEFAELHQLLDNLVPDDLMADGETITITFPKMTRADLDALPEFEG